MIKLDKPFYLLQKASLNDLLGITPVQKIFPITYVLEVPLINLRSWGGRKLDKENNPFTASLEGFNFQQSLKIYEDKIKSIKFYHNLNTNYLNTIFLCNETFSWDKNLTNKQKLNRYKSTMKKELKIISQENLFDRQLIIKREIKRLLSIYKSLRHFGYDEEIDEFTPMRGNLLINGKDFIVLIRHGEHRISCFPKIGLKHAKIWIRACDIIDFTLKNKRDKYIFESIYNGNLKDAPLVNCYGYFFF